jgi:hypothetical protein
MHFDCRPNAEALDG